MGYKTLNQNYRANVEIMKENIKRGMTPSQVYNQVNHWRSMFQATNNYGKEEKTFLNECLSLVEDKTHLGVKIK